MGYISRAFLKAKPQQENSKKKKFLGMKWVLGESMVETVPSIVCLSLLPWNGFLKDSVHIIFQYSSVDMDQEYRL